MSDKHVYLSTPPRMGSEAEARRAVEFAREPWKSQIETDADSHGGLRGFAVGCTSLRADFADGTSSVYPQDA